MTTAPKRSRRSKLASCALWGVLLAPVGISLAHQFLSPTQAAPARVEDRTGLVFDQGLVNLRKIDPTRFVIGHYTFTNRGSEKLNIISLKPSCGCLQPQLMKRVYEPGETGHFIVRVDTTGKAPGPHAYVIKVNYDDGKERELDLHFKFELPQEKVVVRPKALLVYQYGTQPTEQTAYVHDFRKQQLTVTKVESTLPFVQVTLPESELTEEGHMEQPLHILIDAKVPAGVNRGAIQIYTDDAEFPVLYLPMMIHGKPVIATEKPVTEPLPPSERKSQPKQSL